MTTSEKKAITSRTNELISKGIDKKLAKVMAKVEFECGILRPVVYYN